MHHNAELYSMETLLSVQRNTDEAGKIICHTLTVGEMHYKMGYNADTDEFAFSERTPMEVQNMEVPISNLIAGMDF